MKKIIALSIAMLFAVSVFSQDKKVKDDNGKMHIKIEVDKDGKTTRIDTTINPEDLAALNQHLADMDIHIGSGDEDFAGVQSFSFGEGGKELEEHMRELSKRLKDKEINMEEFEKQMEKMHENLKDHHNMFMYKFKTDGDADTDKELLELEQELDNMDMNMNFNFNHDGKTKTIVIDGDDIKVDGEKIKNGKGDKEIIIKKKSAPKGKDGKHKETKKVIIMMKSSSGPEKQTAEFAAEPWKDENGNTPNAERVRVVDKKDNTWLNDLTCYPNPSTGEFTLSFHLSNPEAAELKIMDIAGREVFTENIPENSEWVEKQIQLPVNSSAAYLLILRQGNNWHHEKIFVRS